MLVTAYNCGFVWFLFNQCFFYFSLRLMDIGFIHSTEIMYNCVFISIFIVYSWIYTYKLAIIVGFPLTYSFFFILSVHTCGFYFIYNHITDAELGPTNIFFIFWRILVLSTVLKWCMIVYSYLFSLYISGLIHIN